MHHNHTQLVPFHYLPLPLKEFATAPAYQISLYIWFSVPID